MHILFCIAVKVLIQTTNKYLNYRRYDGEEIVENFSCVGYYSIQKMFFYFIDYKLSYAQTLQRICNREEYRDISQSNSISEKRIELLFMDIVDMENVFVDQALAERCTHRIQHDVLNNLIDFS